MTFEAEWTRCAPWIQAALDASGRTHDLTDVETMVRNREARFWAGANAALVTTIEEFPRRKVLQLWLAGGDLEELVSDMRPRVEDWAREQGCESVWIVGRAGWARQLSAEGYAPAACIVAKDLRA